MVQVTLEDPVLRGYFLCSSILVAKVLFMVYFTGRARFSKKVFINPEDVPLVKDLFDINDAVCKHDDVDVERIRSAHLNDLENIPLFIFIGFIYVLTKPDSETALNIFKTYMWSRIIYSISIALGLPRSLKDQACVISYLLKIYMTLVCMVKFY
ncbi:microsomal glutathione S-transferase 1-like [Planococcus citri]|uniref:microsomal glutathione S-transferase 1-like n=1 Tax=Planococcus citri TaxID=170843 RepID=UPI0031F8EC9D